MLEATTVFALEVDVDECVLFERCCRPPLLTPFAIAAGGGGEEEAEEGEEDGPVADTGACALRKGPIALESVGLGSEDARVDIPGSNAPVAPAVAALAALRVPPSDCKKFSCS